MGKFRIPFIQNIARYLKIYLLQALLNRLCLIFMFLLFYFFQSNPVDNSRSYRSRKHDLKWTDYLPTQVPTHRHHISHAFAVVTCMPFRHGRSLSKVARSTDLHEVANIRIPIRNFPNYQWEFPFLCYMLAHSIVRNKSMHSGKAKL